MLVKKPRDFKASEITDKRVWLQRRRFLCAMAVVGAEASLAMSATPDKPVPTARKIPRQPPIEKINRTSHGANLVATDYAFVTGYNNFYEFGADKDDPVKHAGSLATRPWTVRVDGECELPGEIGIEDILSGFVQQERVYRMRCVEAWAMVIPWVGFPLGDLLRRFKPTSRAKYVAFETLFDPKQMPAQQRRVLEWPYTEGLRIDEAMHPLTLLATGLYGELLPNQNGAPLRLVVPWKYGFKSIKSIVRITFTEHLPHTTWWKLAPDEYGFYANVNPQVSHPRWSQNSHRIIGESVFSARQKTELFNGYADQVAHLYAGMDLTKLY